MDKWNDLRKNISTKKIAKTELRNLLIQSREDVEKLKKLSNLQRDYNEIKRKLDLKLYDIEKEIVITDEKLYNLSTSFQINQNYEKDIKSFGSFTDNSYNSYCYDLISLMNSSLSEFERDEYLFCADLFSGGANSHGRRCKVLIPAMKEYINNLTSIYERLNMTRDKLVASKKTEEYNKLKQDIQDITLEINNLQEKNLEYISLKQKLNTLEKKESAVGKEVSSLNNNTFVINGPPTSTMNLSDSEMAICLTPEHQKVIDDLIAKQKALETETNELKKRADDVQSNMESICQINEETEARVKRLKETLGPLKDKYFLVKNSYISLDTLKHLINLSSGKAASSDISDDSELQKLIQEEADLDKQIEKLTNEINVMESRRTC